jgi:hypothetical protein
MAKASEKQTKEPGAAASAETSLAADMQGAQRAVAVLVAEITALDTWLEELVESEGRRRTIYSNMLAALRAKCDALEAERDHAVEAADRAEAQVDQLQAHIQEQMERDHAALAAICARPTGTDDSEATRTRRARRSMTSRREKRADDAAGPAVSRGGGTDPVGCEVASAEGAAARAEEDVLPVAAAQPPESESGRRSPMGDGVRPEGTVMVTVAVPRWLYTTLERTVAEGASPTIGDALLACCRVGGTPASCLRPPQRRPLDAEAGTTRPGLAAEADGAVSPGG